MGIAADHPAEIAAPIVEPVLRLISECAGPDELVVQSQVRPVRTGCIVEHVLPTTPRKEAMVPACDELCSILERDAVGRLDGGPVVQNFRDPVASIATTPDRSVYKVAWPHVSNRLGRAVTHKDRRGTPNAVQA